MSVCCPRRRQSLLLRILSASLLLPSCLAMWPFGPKRFKGDALIDAGLRGVDSDKRVIAFGDFNGDQFLDLLTLGSDQQTLTVYLWNHEDYNFVKSTSFHHPRKVVNAVPGDFTHSGKLDILIMGDAGNELEMKLYAANPGGGFDVPNPLSIPSSSSSQPIPIDLNGDMKIDLLGMTPGETKGPKPLKVWENVWNASDSGSPLFSVKEPTFDGTQCTVAHPHSNAVVDFNGDCLADLFLVCDDGNGGKSYQIWINSQEKGFYLSQGGTLPSGFQSASFADMNRDGTLDLVFTTCSQVSSSTGYGTDCYINIAFNQQIKLCAKDGEKPPACRSPEALCTADSSFRFNLSDSDDNHEFIKFSVSSLFDAQSSPQLLVLDTTANPSIPLGIKLGDADLDGFPDMLLITASKDGQTPHLIYSVPCPKGNAGVAGCRGHSHRGWKEIPDGAESLAKIKDARGVAFMDMDEDGTLDIMVSRTGMDGYGNVVFVQNNFYYDAFFLKAIVLNGACDSGWCYPPNGSERYHPFGVSYAGASYKYTVLDTTGSRSAAQVAQLPQAAYHSLLTPYSFFGLGRTNNYIENLFVGSTIHSKEYFINMEGVIPNSKVVILPPAVGGGGWRKELYLRPGEWIPWVTVTVVVATLLLAIIVLVLHLNEKREDELERRKASHHINFDAL